jgi:hypothetical protein
MATKLQGKVLVDGTWQPVWLWHTRDGEVFQSEARAEAHERRVELIDWLSRNARATREGLADALLRDWDMKRKVSAQDADK